MMMDDEKTLELEEAMRWANQNYPSASEQHKAAFANAVQYLVTGFSGGYGGPSLREHLVSWSLGLGSAGGIGTISMGGHAVTTITPNGQLPMPGGWTLERAIAYAAALCFDPAQKHIKTLLQIRERELCFDDDPDDIKALEGGAMRGK